MESLDDIFREEEELRLAETRREIAAEQAVWAALTPEQQAAVIAASEAKWAAYQDAIDAQGAAEPEDFEDEEEEED